MARSWTSPQVDFDKDVVFTWNGTTSRRAACRTATRSRPTRAGLTICDATSAAFAMDLPWDKLDVTTFSWQKVLGGEGAHGMLILSPRAVERLESYTPAWPLPKIFRLTAKGKLIEGIFAGETINTPSMLANEDYLVALKWAQVHRRPARPDRPRQGQRARSSATSAPRTPGSRTWPKTRRPPRPPASASSSPIPRITDGEAFAKAVAKRIEKAGAGFDMGAYRDAPPGLRIWCGSTVETADVAGPDALDRPRLPRRDRGAGASCLTSRRA